MLATDFVQTFTKWHLVPFLQPPLALKRKQIGLPSSVRLKVSLVSFAFLLLSLPLPVLPLPVPFLPGFSGVVVR